MVDLLESALDAFTHTASLQNSLGEFTRSRLVTSKNFALWANRSVVVLGLVSGIIDAYTAFSDAAHSAAKNDTWAYIGNVTTGAGALMTIASALVAASGTSLTVGGVPVALGLAIAGGIIAGIGFIIEAFGGDTALETWLAHCYWGNEVGEAIEPWTVGSLADWRSTRPGRNNQLGGLEKQLAALNNIRHRIVIRVQDATKQNDRDMFPGYYCRIRRQTIQPVRLRFTISPSLMYEYSIVQFELSAMFAGGNQYTKVTHSPNTHLAVELDASIRLSAQSGVLSAREHGSSTAFCHFTKGSDGRVTEIVFEELFSAYEREVSFKLMVDIFGNQQLFFPANYGANESKTDITEISDTIDTGFDKTFVLYNEH